MFLHFINGTPKIFDYQWYFRVIERLTTVTFSNFSIQNRQKQLTFFFFPLFFNLKDKGKKKKLTVLDDFRRKKLEKVTVVRHSITRKYH